MTTRLKRLDRGDKYPKVTELKTGAKTVRVYAEENQISIAYVYVKHTRGQANYEIVNYQNVNWVQSK